MDRRTWQATVHGVARVCVHFFDHSLKENKLLEKETLIIRKYIKTNIKVLENIII